MSLWPFTFPEWTFTVDFVTNGFKPPTTESYQLFYFINKCTENVQLLSL
jgi:hypothetical protein